MPTTCKMIAKNVLGSDTASVTFSNIPGTFTDLYLAISGRTDNTGGNGDGVKTTFNSSTTGYSNRRLYGSGVVTGSDTNNGGTASMYLGAVCDNGSTANTFGAFEMYVPNYAGSTNKSVSAVGAQEDNEATAYMIISAGLWSNTAAITSMTLAPGYGTNWKSGSSFFLYGITRSDDNTPGTFGIQATGGDVTISGGYKYHVFKSSGTFTVNEPGFVEMLVVAGGGGGGALGGGGGAGGVVFESRLLRTGPSLIVVGAGGNGSPQGVGTATPAVGSSGSNSLIASISAIGGGNGGTWQNISGSNGGSGGGGGADTGAGGQPTTNQGFAGGSGAGSGSFAGGGGGGGGSVGSVGASGTGNAGNGGSGYSFSTWANATSTGSGGAYASGGGGGCWSGTAGTASSGGGSAGANNGLSASNAIANTGGGGGGGGFTTSLANRFGASGNGGSGIVIIRYPVG